VRAAEQGVSVSRYLGKMVEERMRREHAYEAAMRSHLSLQPRPLKEEGSYPTREDIHDRALLRR